MRILRIPRAGALILALAGTVLIGCSGEAPAAQETRVAAAGGAELVVYKTPTCGCCSGWVDHMEEAGFDVRPVDVDYAELARRKTDMGVPVDLGSCHTGTVAGYTVEGHIPADVVARLLKERPQDIRGIAVPGMPTGSPGMEGPNPQAYDVIAIRKDGSRVVYETVYPGQPSSETR